eukprot:Awhi_evm1s1315
MVKIFDVRAYVLRSWSTFPPTNLSNPGKTGLSGSSRYSLSDKQLHKRLKALCRLLSILVRMALFPLAIAMN